MHMAMHLIQHASNASSISANNEIYIGLPRATCRINLLLETVQTSWGYYISIYRLSSRMRELSRTCSCCLRFFLWRTFEVAGIVLGQWERLQPLYDLLDRPVQERALDFVLHFTHKSPAELPFRYPTVHSVDISQSITLLKMTSCKLMRVHLESTVRCLDTELLWSSEEGTWMPNAQQNSCPRKVKLPLIFRH